ncbi:hypothetical protein HX747_30925 [Streptomyces sp. L06]|nr:hypothetical protein [Streptomyces sp. L06]
MRQLAHEGGCTTGRLLAASFLSKTLYVDWRTGADHFLSLLVDGDIANNQMNCSGSPEPHRHPPPPGPQPGPPAHRTTPTAYVRRWSPNSPASRQAVHEPWKLEGSTGRIDYPEPVGLSGLTGFDGPGRSRAPPAWLGSAAGVWLRPVPGGVGASSAAGLFCAVRSDRAGSGWPQAPPDGFVTVPGVPSPSFAFSGIRGRSRGVPVVR